MSDDPISVCPKCGGHVRRLIGGGTGIIFKGSGFYVTDNKRTGASSTSSPINGDEKRNPRNQTNLMLKRQTVKRTGFNQGVRLSPGLLSETNGEEIHIPPCPHMPF